MSPEPRSDENSPNVPATITFKCVKCGAENELKTDQEELLFGGSDPVSGGARSLHAVSTVRTFIVRCSLCQHTNRIRLEGGVP